MSSFWTTAPREGFSQQCCRYFQCSFDAPQFVVRSDYVPVKHRPHKVRAVYADASEVSGYASKRTNHASAMLSAKDMQKGRLL